jgi:CheY-like chemotaxis protein
MSSSPTETGEEQSVDESGLPAGGGEGQDGHQRPAEQVSNVAIPVRHPAPDTAGHRDLRLSGEQPISGPAPVSLLLYSDDVDTRARVRRSVGRKLAPDLPPVKWTECATSPAVIRAVDKGGFDVLILDGEAAPAGGLGLCKQLKDEKYECPPVLVLTGRPQDAWLATWSRADAAVPHPLDPRALAEAILGLARLRRSEVA